MLEPIEHYLSCFAAGPTERAFLESVLLEPQGRIVFAGTYLSYLAGWQAGAVESAWQQIEKLHLMATTS